MTRILSFFILAISLFSQDLTPRIYWDSQPPEVRRLEVEPDQKTRSSMAEALAKNGYRIDVPVMVYHWDPFQVMAIRKMYGYTWVPSALQPNIEIAPGLTSHGLTPYDPASPPVGSIKVSTEAKDYPPFDKPVSTPKPAQSPVGIHSVGNLYLTVAGDTSPAGTIHSDERGRFVKRINAGPFGAWAYWEKL